MLEWDGREPFADAVACVYARPPLYNLWRRDRALQALPNLTDGRVAPPEVLCGHRHLASPQHAVNQGSGKPTNDQVPLALGDICAAATARHRKLKCVELSSFNQ